MSYEAGKRAIAALSHRRDARVLGSRLPSSGITYDTVIAAAEEAVKESPTAFNSQDTRVITLLGRDHERYWRLVLSNPHTTTQDRARIEKSLLPAMGTMLFFIDNDALMALCRQFPAYAEQMPTYSYQGAAMAVSSAWTTICAVDESLGAIATCYGYPLPLTDGEPVEGSKLPYHPGFPKEMAVPASWRLQSELVFGNVEQVAAEPARVEDSHRFMVFSDKYTSLPVRAQAH